PASLTPATSPLLLHDALPICAAAGSRCDVVSVPIQRGGRNRCNLAPCRSDAQLIHDQLRGGALSHEHAADARGAERARGGVGLVDRKSTRLNSSHGSISYAVF